MRSPFRTAGGQAAPEAAADAFRQRGLAAPARLLADAHRPYLPLIGDLAAFGAPILRALLGPPASAALGSGLTPDGVQRFLARLAIPASSAQSESDPRCRIPQS